MRILSNLSVSGLLGLNSVSDANTDTDKFLVLDSSGIVKYRTGAELYNDIGAGGAASYTSTLQHEVKAGVALTKGQAVYVTSADGTNMIVSKASNASEATSSKTLGLIAQNLNVNGKGFVITEGLLAGLDTSTAGTEGDPVWLGTDGNLIYGLTNKPYAPAHLVFIGIVTRKNSNNGEIFVKVQNGFELQELHNVQITSTPADNTVLAYENSTSLYKMKSIPTLLGYTPVTNARNITINGTTYDLSADRSWSVGTHTGNLTTGYVPKATGITSLTDSLIYDNGSAIGINTASPYESSAFKLDVNGGVIIKNTSGTAAQLILINSNPATGGNNGFVQLSAGGNTSTAFGQWQTYYGMSVASGALRLQPAGGQVLIGTTTTSAFLTDINGTLRVSGQLTLGSTISNNTYVYTMPGASGTLALVSDIPSLSGYVPTSRTLTINGTSYDLSADRSWTIAAGVSAVQAGSGISVSTSSGVVTVVNTGLLSGTAGSGISVSTSGQNLNIVNTGLLSGTAGSGISVSTSGQNLNIVNTGLLSATAGSGISVSTTSQNVNIVNTGLLSATAGTGISVSTTSGTLNIVNTITNTNQLTNGAGYITGITSGMVTTALGYTPYNATNPNGYITGYTETDTLASVTARGASTSTRTTFTEVGATREGSDSVAVGPWFRWTNLAESRQMLTQLNASFGLTTWAYNGSAWSSIYTLTQTGAATFSSSVTAGGNFTATADGGAGGLRLTLNNIGAGEVQYALLSGGSAGTGVFGIRNGSTGTNLFLMNGTGAATFSNTITVNKTGTIISHAGMSDAIGYNSSYGTYIGSVVGGTYYIYANGQMYNNGPIVTLLHSGNYNSYSPTLTGGGASGTWSITATGNVASRGQSNWNDSTVINNVIGLMAWKNYGNNHVIFDASQGTSPSGGGVSQTNATTPWSASYPTLMGWNGSGTYGVRVDSARISDNTSGNSATTSQRSFDYIYATSYLESAGAVYGTIFYDNNDRNYYVDPNSTSRLNILSLVDYQYIGGQVVNGQSHYQWEGATYRNPGGYTAGLIVRRDNSTTGIDGSYPALVLYNNNGGDQTTVAMSFATMESASGGNAVALGGIIAKKSIAGNNGGWSSGSLTFYVKDLGTRRDALYLDTSGYASNGYSFRAPIFYDSNDTTYYVDPNSMSRLESAWVRGASIYDGRIYVGGSSAGNALTINYDQIWTGSGTLHLQYSGSGNIDMNYGGGYTFSRTSLRAPIFYDYDDTSYYADFNSTSSSAMRIRGGALFGPNPTWGSYLQVGGDGNTNSSAASVVTTNGNLHLDSGNGRNTYINHYYGGGIYFGSGGAGGGIYTHSTFSAAGNLYVGGGGTDASHRLHVNGTGFATSDFRAPIFYDSNDTTYYGDFASTSRFNATITNTSYFGADTNKGYAQGYGTYSSQLHRIARITFDWDSNYNQENHGIFSTDINGSYTDSMSLNSFNDITLRLDSNDNNANSYLRISNNTTGSGTIAWIGYESGMNQNYFSGSVGISASPRTDGYKLNMGGSIHLNGNSVDYVGSLYFNNAGHIQPNGGSYGALQMTGNKNGWAGIRFTDYNTNLMTNATECGFHHNDYGWQFRWLSGNAYIHSGTYGGGTSQMVIHSGNIGSQSVSYANSAGSASSAARAFYSIDGFTNTGGHGSSWIQNELPAANNGAATGRVVLRMWCSEPNATWDWAGFGYNVLNDGGSPAAFGRFNTNFGQAYMRFATNGDWYFYNTTVGGTRTTSMSFSSTGAANFGNTVTVSNTLTCNTLNTGNIINLGYTRNGDESIATSSFRGIEFHNPGGDGYYIGKPAGAWTQPLHITFYTGISLRSHHSYGGTQFYNIATGAVVGSFNEGDNNMRGYYDIIAYASDRRLKENVKVIDNAIDKIKQLTGMTYTWNSVGAQYGWAPSNEREAGVFAQDVQSVLPEAVKLAPFDNDGGKSKSGENFLTVKYEKIVPLLIEAIKEQQTQIEDLKSKLDAVTK
jgi:predicted heme/steroid binding protein